MGFWNNDKELKARVLELEKKNSELVDSAHGSLDTNSSYYGNTGHIYPVITETFDGEKTPGELGAYRNSLPNHNGLRYRAYEAELKSDVVKIITGKFFKWIIGSGLKLSSEPNLTVLETEGLKFDNLSDFRKNVEARFSIYAKSKFSSHSKMGNLHTNGTDGYKTAFLGGDCLCVLRIDDKLNLSSQVIDGQDVQSPYLDTHVMDGIKSRGNTEDHGIEIAPNGEHVAFYVLVPDEQHILGKFTRIAAKGEKTGRKMAWMIYGAKHRINHARGIPNLTAILEKVEKLDRYTEAAVGSAEERAKIVYAIEHNKDSDGENPLLGKARQAAGIGHNAAKETAGYHLGTKTASTIAATTSKQTFNMPIGAQLKALDSTSEVQFEEFSKAVFVYLCAAMEIPAEVALQQYNSNYSASRAAINGWGYIVEIYRDKFAMEYYKPFYDMWLEIEIIKGKIKANGFIKAIREENFMIVDSFSSSKFKGVNMPHIDPLKEVKAVRAMLGNDTDALISREQASELLQVGDWEKNFEKHEMESELIPDPVVDDGGNGNGGNGNGNGDAGSNNGKGNGNNANNE